MNDDTPSTNTDPALGSEGESDQLSLEDTLEDRGVDDLLDEGYSPPERPRSNHYGETAWEQHHREPLDQRLAEEEPEIWAPVRRPRPDKLRSGRLMADEFAIDGESGNDTIAHDVGIDGGAASAEEAAVHVIEEP
ncbi:DUF5709 domain-containing protein [Cellulomonas sp. P24]|uniref:DUF5709 domain-containing protein n=1 Tax=Cellulomonas sp. P24 TaxID=2885206 RepID=UPI00216AEBAF|nr:DUF5709 domain-containing protein [Cellulomonas sp. P24]MCR6492256.1 DUF5709 domain-containing protein [Cellulomonas sp. P24]